MDLSDVRSAIMKIAREVVPQHPIRAEVMSVDLEDKTATVKDNATEIEYANIRLVCKSDANGSFLMLPTVGSEVEVVFSEGSDFEGYVVQYSEIDKFQLIIDSSQLTINKDGIVMNGGDLGGLVKIGKLVDKINELEQKYNDLLNSCKTQSVVLAPTGTFPMASFFAANLPITPKTSLGDLENEKVKH